MLPSLAVDELSPVISLPVSEELAAELAISVVLVTSVWLVSVSWLVLADVLESESV